MAKGIDGGSCYSDGNSWLMTNQCLTMVHDFQYVECVWFHCRKVIDIRFCGSDHDNFGSFLKPKYQWPCFDSDPTEF